jgi:hypothetical protein
MRSDANQERPRQPSRQLKNGPAPGEGGAPVKELDLNIVQKLAMIQCTDKEIAACLDVSEDTITRRKQNDPEFLEVLERGRGTGRMSLRRHQWERAQAGSDTMLIWLGKQILGQRDRFEHGGDPDNPLTVRYVIEVPTAITSEEDWRARYAPPTIDAEPVKE